MCFVVRQIVNHREYIKGETGENDKEFNKRMSRCLAEEENREGIYLECLSFFNEKTKIIKEWAKLYYEKTGKKFRIENFIFPSNKGDKYKMFLSIIELFQKQGEVFNELNKKILNLLK